jgi:hypothetical protein
MYVGLQIEKDKNLRLRWIGYEYTRRRCGDERQNQEGSRSKLSDLPSPPLDVGADHQLLAPSESHLASGFSPPIEIGCRPCSNPQCRAGH